MSRLRPDARTRAKMVYRPADLVAGLLASLLAAGLDGTIFALIKAVIDRGAAEGTRKLTGTWPGKEGQQPRTSA